MVRTIDEMGVMLDETLRFARDDGVREPTREIEIGALVDEVVAEHRALGRQVEWAASPGIRYRCRPVSLKRALHNLVDNATRYGNVCWIRVSGGGARQDLCIEVEDDGPGIDPGLIERAFEPFARLDPARNQEAGGVGLGLAIVRSCVRAHGGDVSLQNRSEGGLRVVIVLPA